MSRYLLAAGATGLALAARLGLNPVLGEGSFPFITLFVTLALVVANAGTGPAVLALLLGAAGAALLILPPADELFWVAPGVSPGLAIYLLAGGGIVLAGHLVNRARERADENARAARASEAQVRAVIRSANAGLVQVDAGGRMTLVNQRFCEMLGYSERELLGRRLTDVVDPAAAAEAASAIAKVAGGGQDLVVEKHYRRKDGTQLAASCSLGGLKGADDQVQGVVAVVIDVSERRRMEEALREADRRKDEFLAILAHELRNPLAPLRTGLELLRVAPDKAAAYQKIGPLLERQVVHLVRLIDDLLDVSRITSGRIQLERRPTPLAELVHDAVDASRAAIDLGGLQLSLELPAERCHLDVDPTRFVQVLSNLLHNAVKFTERGGRIAVTAAVDRHGGAPSLSLTIRDSGVGIAPAMLPRLFDLFVQGERPGGGKGGLGIGLALSRQLVELQGGHIDVESAGAGRGSAFTIRMPIAPPPAQAAAPAGESPAGLDRRVLIIDDNADAADTLAALVAALGGEAEAAHSGEEGLRRAALFRPDVILLDIGMPGMDGYETCRRLRAEPCGRQALIVALTGWGQEQDRRRALESGFDAHLTKPADPRTLRGILSSPVAQPRV